VIKKQDQRLSDLKKLLQRELKMVPPTGDDDLTATQSTSAMSGRSLSHIRNNSSVSVDSVSAVGICTSEMSQSSMALNDHGIDVRNGSGLSLDLSSAAGIHKSATAQVDVTSPATLSISDQHTVNGQHTPTNCSTTRSARGQRSGSRGQRSSAGSQAGVVMSSAESEYDFVRELNFKYLRHVVLKFMLSREAEVMMTHFAAE